MSEDRLEEPLRAAAQDYHRPVATPREEIWRAVQQARAAARGREGPRRPARPWLPLAAAAVVVLAAGIGIGRLTRTGSSSEAAPAATTAEVNAAAYRLATLEHLSQSEEFLTLFRASVGHADQRPASVTARRLLGTNRLLLDSPAARDRRTRLLLEDLELVLAGIAQLSNGRPQDVDLITDGIERGNVRPRLRTAVPAGTAPSPGAL